MDHSDLLDYALGQLDGSRCAELEGRLAADPVLHRRFARLESRLVRLLDDGQTEASRPSPGPRLTSADE